MQLYYCQTCNLRISDEELNSGGAVIVSENVAYCAKCAPQHAKGPVAAPARQTAVLSRNPTTRPRSASAKQPVPATGGAVVAPYARHNKQPIQLAAAIAIGGAVFFLACLGYVLTRKSETPPIAEANKGANTSAPDTKRAESAKSVVAPAKSFETAATAKTPESQPRDANKPALPSWMRSEPAVAGRQNAGAPKRPSPESFRFVDLSAAFTADSRRGIFQSLEAERESVHIVKYGAVTADGIPFQLSDPAAHPRGKDLVVLKGGGGPDVFSQTMPRSVEASVGLAAVKLHLLSGVGGWAYPFGGEKHKGLPALKVTLHHAGGDREEFVLKNGEEFADYIGIHNVPGSKLASGVARDSQLRWLTLTPKSKAVIERLRLESFDNIIAPVVAAITVELPEGRPSAVAPAKSAPRSGGSLAKLMWNGLRGGQEYHNFLNQTKSSIAIWGKGAKRHALTGSFNLASAPSGPTALVATSLRHGRKEPCKIAILINGREIFNGGDPSTKREWGEYRFAIPAGVLKAGANELRINNLEDTNWEGRDPWYMVHAVEILAAATEE